MSTVEYIVSFTDYDPKYGRAPWRRSFEGEAPAKIYARRRAAIGYQNVKLTKVTEEEISFCDEDVATPKVGEIWVVKFSERDKPCLVRMNYVSKSGLEWNAMEINQDGIELGYQAGHNGNLREKVK